MPQITRRTVLAGLSAFAAYPAFADQWPSRPIVLIHGFPAGGPADTLARIMSDGLSRNLGQPIVVEARPGATGTTAGGLAARAQPDGYTLMWLPATFPTTAAMLKSLPYRPTDDFTFISTVSEYPLVLLTHPESGIQNLDDLVKRARAQKSPLLYGTAGVGSLMHLAMELLALKTDAPLQHVPYQGGLPALTDLMGKRIDLVLDPPATAVQFVKAQKLRAIAVTGTERFDALADVPTAIEAGISGFSAIGYSGVVAPRGLPQQIVARLDDALAAALSKPETLRKLKNAGNVVRRIRAEEFKAQVAADIERWKRVVDEAHIARI
jgi:tripartite-type tricarboxylate transporter receptor subunit TctC